MTAPLDRGTGVAERPGARREGPSVAKAWSRALELTAPIARNPSRIFSTVVEEQAALRPDAPALISETEGFTYRELAARARNYGQWARDQGLGRGDVVCLLLPNRPEYFAAWLGISSVGAVAALLNTNLTGRGLSHCINVARPSHILVGSELVPAFETALPQLSPELSVWLLGDADRPWPRIDAALERLEAARPVSADSVAMVDDIALYIYTSGTTGLPKAARVSHARIMQWTHWFAALTDASPDDRMYNCLPMYHSVGGVLATGAALVGGGAVVIRDRFSARRFWDDIVRWDCTLFQYIGELCRYLLHAPPHPLEQEHRLRLCCGNGLGADVWEPFQTRFAIPRILEFYASTEGNVSLFNVEGKPGAVGRIPPFLAHRFPAAVVKFDIERQLPLRDERGLCVRCAPDEPGEVLGKLMGDGSNVGGRFEGYTDADASELKMLRDVFEPGDAWFRTGDLMRRDAQGFFYFVDRIGDTFRWKGENVATGEVSEAICEWPGVQEASVYGVRIPGVEGRAAMATLVVRGDLDLAGLRAHLGRRLPPYARPLFVRLTSQLEMTATFKQTKTALVRDGYDPTVTSDPVFFDHPERQAYVRVDQALCDAIAMGRIRI